MTFNSRTLTLISLLVILFTFLHVAHLDTDRSGCKDVDKHKDDMKDDKKHDDKHENMKDKKHDKDEKRHNDTDHGVHTPHMKDVHGDKDHLAKLMKMVQELKKRNDWKDKGGHHDSKNHEEKLYGSPRDRNDQHHQS